MPENLISVDQVSKKFARSKSSALRHALVDLANKAIRRKPKPALRHDEFWALRDISFGVQRGECLQPLLSGRENIYIQCTQLGLNKRDVDARLDDIIAFADLNESIDAPVRTYSDGMYARLEFSVATFVSMDILLIDEVLAVGDIAFQLRSLERLNQLKQHGTAIIFVSHSEMNVRQVADPEESGCAYSSYRSPLGFIRSQQDSSLTIAIWLLPAACSTSTWSRIDTPATQDFSCSTPHSSRIKRLLMAHSNGLELNCKAPIH